MNVRDLLMKLATINGDAEVVLLQEGEVVPVHNVAANGTFETDYKSSEVIFCSREDWLAFC